MNKETLSAIKSTALALDKVNAQTFIDMCEVVERLIRNIETLADQYESIGRIAEAKEVRGLSD